jgi:hypothetical protein
MGFAPKKIVISVAAHKRICLNSCTAVAFWQDFFTNAFLEFIYVHKSQFLESKCLPLVLQVEDGPENDSDENGTTPTTLGEEAEKECKKKITRRRIIVPLGGGKDSIVAWHLAVQTRDEYYYPPHLLYVCDGLYEYEGNWRLQKIVDTMSEIRSDQTKSIVRHDFNDRNFQRYSRSFLHPCGHPWAALVLFDSVLVGSLLGRERSESREEEIFHEISLGFEKSADEGNGVFIAEREVNHQFDKSSEFVDKTQSFILNELQISNIQTLSPLAEMWELEIAKLFCQIPVLRKFHSLFLSCNEPVDVTRWCCVCDKCCFIFILLSAYLPKEEVVTIFHGNDLFENENLIGIFLRLVGSGVSDDTYPLKAFECVGTHLEARSGVELAIRKREENPLPICLHRMKEFLVT